MGSRNTLDTDLGVQVQPDESTLLTSPELAIPEVAHLTIFHRLGAEGGRMLIRVVGEIDLTTAPALADALELARFAAEKIPELIDVEVDLRAVEFLSAAGLTELVRAHHRCDHDAVLLRVVADHSAVTRPLRLTGLDQMLGLRADPELRAPLRARCN